MARMMIVKTSRMLWCALMILSASETIAPSAHAQPLPCRYEVAAVIQAPSCSINPATTIGTAINPAGTTVVGYRMCLGVPRPWKWTQATGLVMLTMPSWLLEASPTDVNDNNIAVGTGVGAQAGQRGWMCDLNTGVWTELLPQNPPTGWSGANAISSDNTVVGFRSIGSKSDPVHPFTAFKWSAGAGFVDLVGLPGTTGTATGIEEDGTVVGSTGGPSTSAAARAVIWNNGQTTVMPAAPDCTNSYAIAIGPSGVLVRGLSNASTTRSFLLDKTGYHDLGTLSGFSIVLADEIDASNGVVGRLVLPQPAAFVWQSGVMRNLTSLLPIDTIVDAGNATTPDGIIVASGASGTLVLQPVRLAGDAVPDCRVNSDDLISVIQHWGTSGASAADVTADGVVDVDDLVCVILSWTP